MVREDGSPRENPANSRQAKGIRNHAMASIGQDDMAGLRAPRLSRGSGGAWAMGLNIRFELIYRPGWGWGQGITVAATA